MNNLEILKYLNERIERARRQKEFYLDRVDGINKEENEYNRTEYLKYRAVLDELLTIKADFENELLKRIKEGVKYEQ